MTRRSFVIGFFGIILGNALARMGFAGTLTAGETFTKISRSRKEWKALLTADRFEILREEGTEPPYSSPLLTLKKKGLYVCAGCDLPLFTSETKYDSRTGWPSFYTTIKGRVETKTDYRLIFPRTEYHCARCGGHQGHLFKDGPPPTYQRWCNNGLALKFIPAS